MKRGVYPGSFNPPTIAHLGIAAAAHDQHHLDVVHLSISRVALAKETVQRPAFDARVAAVEASVADLDWLDVVVTEAQLLADIAEGYDALILGGDKWVQLHDLQFYDSPEHMDACLAGLPDLAIAPRDGVAIPPELQLDLSGEYADVSSSAVRAGRSDWMTNAARSSGLWS